VGDYEDAAGDAGQGGVHLGDACLPFGGVFAGLGG
jgi:hypothetical protein